MDLKGGMFYFGGHFDEDKIEAYRLEVGYRGDAGPVAESRELAPRIAANEATSFATSARKSKRREP
jgi:hypothetical protein